MKRAMGILLLCVLGAGLVACAAHGDGWSGDESTAVVSHILGCGLPLMTGSLATVLPFLPLLLGGLLPLRGPRRPLRRPVSFFRPPKLLA